MDRIELLDRFIPDAVNRATEAHRLPGGKGGNVARAVRRLGEPVAIYGFAGGIAGAYLRVAFARLLIEDRQTQIGDETRICTVVVERDPPRSTMLNEPGPVVTPSETRALVESLVSDCRGDDLVALCGSLPRGLEARFYRDLVDAVRSRGARVIVDARGEVLFEALRARPWMAKANARELGEALTLSLDARDQAALVTAMRGLLGAGTEVVAITLGKEGAVATVAASTWRARVPAIEPRNPTGAGDLFLGGFIVALQRGGSVADALRLGSACGVAGAQNLTPELPSGDDLAALAARVEIEPA